MFLHVRTARRRSGRTCAIALTALLALSSLGGGVATAQSRSTLKIATSPSDLGAEVFYAKDLGYFDKAGIDATITPMLNGAAIISGVVSGALDIGWSNVPTLAIARQRGIPVTILWTAALFAPGSETSGQLAVLKTSPIRSARDLNGKTVAVLSLGNLSEFSIREWMARNGGDPKSVKLIEMPYSEMAAAVRAGRVDAASMDNTADPQLGTADDNLRLVANVFESIAARFAASVWFSTTDWVTKHPNEAKQFVAIMRQTSVWANQYHAESAAILAKNTAYPLAQINRITRVVYGTNTHTDLIQPTLDIAAKYRLISATFPAQDLISPVATDR